MDALARFALAFVLASTVASTACRREAPVEASPRDAGDTAEAPPTGAAPAEPTADATGAGDTTTTGRTAHPVPTADAAAPPSLAIADVAGVGPHLVDGLGRALYVFGDDLGASTCREDCLRRWPALAIAPDVQPQVSDALQAGNVGTFEREDGVLHVTYFRRPLYLYVRDTAPGQRNGHDVTDEFGHWSLVAPDGKPLATAE